MEPPYYTSSLPVSILADASFAILSALTGAAILANNYSGYNLGESFTMALIGSPFLMVYGAVAGLYCGERQRIRLGNILLVLSGDALACNLIGYAIYNEFKASKMSIAETVAGSITGTVVLLAPVVFTISATAICSNRNELNSENIRRLEMDNNIVDVKVTRP